MKRPNYMRLFARAGARQYPLADVSSFRYLGFAVAVSTFGFFSQPEPLLGHFKPGVAGCYFHRVFGARHALDGVTAQFCC